MLKNQYISFKSPENNPKCWYTFKNVGIHLKKTDGADSDPAARAWLNAKRSGKVTHPRGIKSPRPAHRDASPLLFSSEDIPGPSQGLGLVPAPRTGSRGAATRQAAAQRFVSPLSVVKVQKGRLQILIILFPPSPNFPIFN